MKGKIICILCSLILIGLLSASVSSPILYRQTGDFSALAQVSANDPPATCANNQPIHSGLAASHNPILRKLAQYETICRGGVVNKLMVFTPMPTTETEALTLAKQTAVTLKEFSKYKIEPLVVFEPTTNKPQELADIHSGQYDAALITYYKTMTTEGIASRDMGTWVLFPEANTPEWGSTDPIAFVKNVNRVGKLQKQYFPASKISILLNSRSYQSGDVTWSNGKLTSLTPYTTDITPGLVDSFGYQGFPYVSPADQKYPISQVSAGDFIPSNLAIEAAKNLGVKVIWLNTGTFARMYTQNPSKTVTATSLQRQTILDDIATIAQTIQNDGYNVSINLFAQDKSQTAEQIDWSYWKTDTVNNSLDTQVFDTFLRTLRVNHIDFSLYDQ